ncbi:MAG: DUF86 domain-containing protein [Lachnospiraceae bacterium]|nr:DUF86 domain-containing protein [Lachnospiraceae bacterium]
MDNPKNDQYFVARILKNLSFPWYGLRNRIVHDYGSVDFSVVYDTLKNDIPVLQMAINRVNDTK